MWLGFVSFWDVPSLSWQYQADCSGCGCHCFLSVVCIHIWEGENSTLSQILLILSLVPIEQSSSWLAWQAPPFSKTPNDRRPINMGDHIRSDFPRRENTFLLILFLLHYCWNHLHVLEVVRSCLSKFGNRPILCILPKSQIPLRQDPDAKYSTCTRSWIHPRPIHLALSCTPRILLRVMAVMGNTCQATESRLWIIRCPITRPESLSDTSNHRSAMLYQVRLLNLKDRYSFQTTEKVFLFWLINIVREYLHR